MRPEKRYTLINKEFKRFMLDKPSFNKRKMLNVIVKEAEWCLRKEMATIDQYEKDGVLIYPHKKLKDELIEKCHKNMTVIVTDEDMEYYCDRWRSATRLHLIISFTKDRINEQQTRTL
jgi:hypothetical protein